MSRSDRAPALLHFDASRCDGFGMCSLLCPERISLDPWGFAHVDAEVITDAGTRRRATRAVRGCPRQALRLSVVETPNPTGGGRAGPDPVRTQPQ